MKRSGAINVFTITIAGRFLIIVDGIPCKTTQNARHFFEGHVNRYRGSEKE